MSDTEFDDEQQRQKWQDFIKLFQNNDEEEFDDLPPLNSDSPFLETVSEDVSTDILIDLKKGIYSLFVNLINSQIMQLGPENAVKSSIDYLEEIIYNFKQAIYTDQE